MDNQDAILAAKKNVKRIKRAGLSAEILGWLLILSAGGAVWIFETKSNALAVFCALVLVGLYFVLTGSYIKNVQGRKTKSFLLINGIIALPLCAFIFPIYVCVASINNYSRYKDLPRQVQELYRKRKGFKLKILEIVIVVLTLALASASLVIRTQDLSKQTSANDAQATNGPVVFSEPKYKFQIKFPSQPATTDFTFQDNGHVVPYTTYVSHSSDGSQDYNLYAYNWPAQYYNFSKQSTTDLAKSVSKAVDRYVLSRKGTVVNRQASTYLGKPSEDAQFTSPTLSSPVKGYIRVFYIGNIEYDIITLNAQQSDFTNFANTFQYTGN
jgi:hypothetical protein